MKRVQFLILILILILNSSCEFPEHYFASEPECKTGNIDDLEGENLIAKLKDKQPEDY